MLNDFVTFPPIEKIDANNWVRLDCSKEVLLKPVIYDSSANVIKIKSDYDEINDNMGWFRHSLVYYIDNILSPSSLPECPTVESAAYAFQFEYLNSIGIRSFMSAMNLLNIKSNEDMSFVRYWNSSLTILSRYSLCCMKKWVRNAL